MNSKRKITGKLGHVVQLCVNVNLNLPIFYIGEERLETEECLVLLP